MSQPATTVSSGAPSGAASAAIVDPSALVPDLAPGVQAKFVEVLAQWGNVRAAAAQAGVSRAHCYRMRRASAEFRQLWDAALVLARPQVEEVLADRALNGQVETVFYHGEEIATRTRYDTRLLLAHLARLDKVEETYGVRAAVRDFEERVETLREGPVRSQWDGHGDAAGDEAAAEC
ncbi:hypothetical protein [Porphyrobacter sp. AAP82]|uniref:hypothetical protein n=1 Tax=Porphyrobacter sp. AAP82 TaxID=1248917 RepID=UPI000312E7EA|nr:hypothetical protein [Porphyrobacter sp. AAP82]